MTTIAGTTLLARQNLRRDRILAPVWVVVLVLLSYASAAATPGLYRTTADQVRAAEGINGNAAIVALYGPILDVHSVGELAMTKMTVLYALFAAILFVVLVRRHTRIEEESGRAELSGGAGVGRDAPMAAAVVEGVLVALALGLLVALVNTAGGLDAVGSLAFGAVWAGTGLVAVGVAAVACQVAASARTCAAVAATVLGVFFVIRAIGDITVGWLSWLSPLGWNTRFQAYSDPRWWMLVLYVATAAGLLVAAQVLRAHRDLGAGLVAARPGPATGSPRLGDALGLCLRVHFTAILLWTLAMGALGMLFGFILPGLDDMLDSATAQQVLDDLGGALIAAVLSVLAVVVTCFGITVVGHTGADETDGRTELVLATGTSRTRWFAATGIVAFAGQTWLLLVVGVALQVGDAGAGGSGADIVGAALAWTPATWVVTALAACCLAVGGRWAVLGWVWPALFVTLTMVGDLTDLPGWLLGISPYSRVPAMPAEPFDPGAAGALTAVAAVLLVLAWLRFDRRDIG